MGRALADTSGRSTAEERIVDERTMDERTMEERFGPLTLTMLRDTPLSPAWSLNFVANFFTGPVYRDIGERYGVSRPEFVILFSLSQKPGLVARDVCLATGLPKNSISRAVAELLGKGLVRRETDTDDRRAKVLMLTSPGRALLEEVVPLVEARQTAMRAALTADERALFDRLLAKIVYAMPAWVNSD